MRVHVHSEAAAVTCTQLGCMQYDHNISTDQEMPKVKHACPYHLQHDHHDGCISQCDGPKCVVPTRLVPSIPSGADFHRWSVFSMPPPPGYVPKNMHVSVQEKFVSPMLIAVWNLILHSPVLLCACAVESTMRNRARYSAQLL